MSQPAQGSTLPEQSADDVMLAALVERARAGDVAAFTALYERFYVPICRYLARLVGDDDLGNDLAQDTFLAAWRALPGTEDGSYFVPWLYRIASNLARSHLRRARLIRWLPWAGSGGYHPEGYPSIAGPEEQTGEAERIKLALTGVSPKNRSCLLLQLDVGFSQREIARLLGLNEKSVSVYISRGRQQFRQAYERLEHEADVKAKGGPTG
ncbi:MAG TPA: RNA polymerase sigma factor [Ktedonobacterales bacterium]|nr:RNA polymerase sigma factor [Ktedonobacterales bacterium]